MERGVQASGVHSVVMVTGDRGQFCDTISKGCWKIGENVGKSHKKLFEGWRRCHKPTLETYEIAGLNSLACVTGEVKAHNVIVLSGHKNDKEATSDWDIKEVG